MRPTFREAWQDVITASQWFAQFSGRHKVASLVGLIFTVWIGIGASIASYEALQKLFSASERAKSSLTAKGIEYREDNYFYALRRGDIEIVKLFLKAGSRVNIRDDIGRTPLCTAIDFCYFALIDLLLTKGANVNLCSSEDQKCPLHYAVNRYVSLTKDPIQVHNRNDDASRMKLVVEKLLKRGANISSRTSFDYSALMLSVASADFNFIRMLIQSGAVADDMSDDGAFFPLWNAIDNDDPEVLKLLLESGEKVNKATRTNNETALSKAVSLNRTKHLEILLAAGADPNQRLHDGRTLLWYATTPEMAERILKLGIAINAQDSTGYTRTFWAAIQQNTKLLEFLLSKGSDPNIQNKYAQTALSVAISDRKGDEVISLLRRYGAVDN